MRKWSLTSQHLPSITIAADARLSVPDYFDDQIWELSLDGGDPPAFAIETTYGLRARGFRIFPRFIEEDRIRTDPKQFSVQPTIKHFYPNYLVVAYSPLDGIDVESEFWVPESKAVTGRVLLINRDNFTHKIQFELDAVLTPIDDGERMAPKEIQATTFLSGKSGDLYPVLFLTGGPLIASGPFPGLTLDFEIPPGGQRQVTWVHAALSTTSASFDLARKIASKNWEAECAKIDMVNTSQVQILTGEQDWDIAFALSQKIALELLTGPTDQLPHPSFVMNRLPDQGYSIRGDGSDYSYTWNGQSPLISA